MVPVHASCILGFSWAAKSQHAAPVQGFCLMFGKGQWHEEDFEPLPAHVLSSTAL